jgi:hypothetical protein
MKFSLRFLLGEVTLIAIFLAVLCHKPIWLRGENFALHAVETIVMSTLLGVSFCAAIGGLFLKPWHGALVGFAVALILASLALVGEMY